MGKESLACSVDIFTEAIKTGSGFPCPTDIGSERECEELLACVRKSWSDS